MRPVVLVAGGLDPSGGAGIARDVAVLAGLGVSARAVATALTVQDEDRFDRAEAVDAALVRDQVRAAVRRGRPDAVKVGMAGSPEVARVLAEAIDGLRDAGPMLVVVDPVLRASADNRGIDPDALRAVRELLVPRATVLTPNLPEAGLLAGMEETGPDGAIEAARRLQALGAAAVVVKGGHAAGSRVVDLVRMPDGTVHPIARARVAGTLHGTGCRFASALAGLLALGVPLVAAVRRAGARVAREVASCRR